MSSGVHVQEWYMQVYCRVCLFEGEGLVFIDPEVRSWYWDCPKCKHEWDCEGVPRMEDQL
jgi:hypothetical protein